MAAIFTTVLYCCARLIARPRVLSPSLGRPPNLPLNSQRSLEIQQELDINVQVLSTEVDVSGVC